MAEWKNEDDRPSKCVCCESTVPPWSQHHCENQVLVSNTFLPLSERKRTDDARPPWGKEGRDE